MYVQMTKDDTIASKHFSAGNIVEIPHEYYAPASMSRLGTGLSAEQRAALIRWENPSAPIVSKFAPRPLT